MPHPTIRIVPVPHRGTPKPRLDPLPGCHRRTRSSVAMVEALHATPEARATALANVAQYGGCVEAATALLAMWGSL